MEAAVHKTVNRSAAPRPAPAAAPVQCTVPAGRVQLQSALRVSSPKDPAEKEAEATAKKIMRMSAPDAAVGSATGGPGVLRKAEKEEERKDIPGDTPLRRKLESPYIARFADSVSLIQKHGAGAAIARQGEGQPDVSSSVAAEISQSRASGSPLPGGVRGFMEPRFGADFSGVRIHTGESAARLSRQVSAQAFTVGNQIFFGRDRFQPDTHEGKHLIAHELTHTIQQGAAAQQGKPVQRSEDVSVTQQAPPQVQRLGISDALDFFARQANNIPGFRMFTIVLGVNPINMSAVDRSAANILRAVVEFMPGGGLITQALDNYGVFDRVGAWIEQQLRSLGITGSAIRAAVNRFLDSLSWRDIFNLGGVWDRARRIFSEPIDRIISFVRSLGAAVLRFIKDAILRPLAQLASQTRGWDLLKAVLGRDPITGDPVPRTAETLIGGFMRLIGQEEIWQNIQRGNAVARAWAWFQGALSGLMGFVRQIPQLFIQALQSLQIADIVVLPRAFARVAGVFGNFIGSFLSWAGNTVWNLLEIIFSVVAPGAMPYLQRAAGAFRTILRNPIGFVGNLVRAGIQGFRQFAGNFLTHLRASLIGWLTGAMSGANIYIPQGFNLREILKFVLSVLGLTWQNIRQKLVRAVGETAVRAMETGFDIVVTLVTQGPAAAWEKIQESLSNLREMVMEQIMTFVRDRVVQAAVIRLVSMLNPAGAFIQAIIAIYNTVMFFIERLRQIAQVAMSFIDSIAAIAAGNIAAAANRVEQTMAGLLTLVISFLARIAGLGRVSDAVTNVINRVRQPIDRALDRVVDWIVAQARRLGRLIASGARAVIGWLRHRASFRTIDGQNHSLYFEQRGDRAQLIRASDLPTEILAYLNTLSFPSGDPRVTDLGAARTLAGQIQLLTRTPTPGQAATTPQQEADIIQKVSDLSRLLMRLVNVSLAQLPPAADWSQRAKSNTAQYSKVYLLSSLSATGGSAASGTSPEYDYVAAAGWVRMHLIPYSVGGRGGPDNWVPAPSNVNSGGPVRSFETALETAVRSAAIPAGSGMRPRPAGPAQPNVVWVEAEVDGFKSPITGNQGQPLHFPDRVSFRFGLYRPDGTNWVKLNEPVSRQNVAIPPVPDNKIRLSSASGTAMRGSGLPHLTGQAYSNRLVDLIKDVRGAGFSSYAVLQSRLLAATVNSRLLTPGLISAIVSDFSSNPGIVLR